jgi:glycosyltransferase 2 family protein
VTSERATIQPRSGYPFWKWAVAVPLAAALLYLALRGVEWKRVASIVAHCRVRYLVLACCCGTLAYIVRAMRWRVLLTAGEKLAPTTVLWASSVGYLANNYLPARAGELVRTAMISSRSRLSKAYVFTTAMAERVIELVILVVMASVMSLTLAHRPLWLSRLTFLVTFSAIGGAASLLALPRIDRARTGLITRLPVSPRMKDRVHRITKSVNLALVAIREPWRLTRVCAISALIWALDATAAVILAHALGLHLMFPVALLLLTGLALGNALPSTPGAIGIFQFAAITVLTPFNFSRSDAIAYILVAQAAAYVVITTLGLIGLWRYRVSGRRTRVILDPASSRG